MNSTRIAFLAILTVCMFALVDFLRTGFWLFPFPIYKTGLFVTAVCMLILEKKKPDLISIMAVCWTACFLFTSRFFLQLFMKEKAIETFNEGLFTDYITIAGLLLFTAWGLLFSLGTNNRILKIVNSFLVLCFGGCLLLNLYDIAIVPLFCWTIGMFLGKRKSGISEGVLILIVFIYCSTWIMGFHASSQLKNPAPNESATAYILKAM